MNSCLKLSATLLLMVGMDVPSFSQTPSYMIIEKLPIVEWSKKEKGANLSEQEKLERLKMLPKGDRVEFIDYYEDLEEDTSYWELSLSGLYYLDLDFDGDLDLLYSAQNGSMRKSVV